MATIRVASAQTGIDFGHRVLSLRRPSPSRPRAVRPKLVANASVPIGGEWRLPLPIRRRIATLRTRLIAQIQPRRPALLRVAIHPSSLA